MRKIKSLLLLVLFSTALLSACKKEDTYDAAAQLQTDDQLIQTYISTNSIPAIKHQSGVYYQIIAPGTGSVVYTANTNVRVKYTGKLLNGQVFDQNTTGVTFPLGNLIYGWQVGIPLIQKGGSIRLLVPSGYAYGPQAQSGIPANSVLDFQIELIDIFQ